MAVATINIFLCLNIYYVHYLLLPVQTEGCAEGCASLTDRAGRAGGGEAAVGVAHLVGLDVAGAQVIRQLLRRRLLHRCSAVDI